ncbi:OmpW/AlkL family protein [Azorhizophilus paspali]|uniref:OmpW/AlkL family protein n=1 Tax=Azorhizophilus paspali TaxID=69963 RepID=UPI00363329F4
MAKFKSLFALFLIGIALAAPYAIAHERGDIVLRAGAVVVDPHEDSEDIRLAGAGKLPGTKATLDSDVQLGLNYLYMLTDHVGIEYLAATPFTHEAKVKGLPGDLNGRLGDFKQLPPTVSLVYYPFSPHATLQPYVGVGLNYTYIFETKLGKAAEGKGFSGLDMQDSIGLAAQVGVDYMLTDTLMLNAQVRYIDIESKATTYLNDSKVTVDVDVNPWVYMVALGYKF